MEDNDRFVHRSHLRPEDEPWDEVLINQYLKRLELLETDTVNIITGIILRFSAWGVGLSLTYVKLIPDFEFTTASFWSFISAWVFWLISFVLVVISLFKTVLFTWFNLAVGLYRRFLPGYYWNYRERYYMVMQAALVAFVLGFLSIIVFIAFDFFAPPDTTSS